MSCCVLYFPLVMLGASLTLANVVVPISVADTPVVAGEPLSNSKLVYHETGRLQDLRQQLVEDVELDSVPVDVPGNTEPHGGPSQQLKRRNRFWSSSESEEEPAAEPDHSGYAAAIDALLEYYAQVQRQGRQEVNVPDMTGSVLFIDMTMVLGVSGARLRVPATLSRVSRVSAHRAPSGEVLMSTNIRLGDLQVWGQYDAKVEGVGLSGDFNIMIRGRVVRVTVRYSELPERSEGEAPGRCRLETDEVVLMERGASDIAVFIADWAAEVEDVAASMNVMKQLLNERLAQFPCGDAFVGFVRRGDASA